jgi:hypothetical protein
MANRPENRWLMAIFSDFNALRKVRLSFPVFEAIPIGRSGFPFGAIAGVRESLQAEP